MGKHTITKEVEKQLKEISNSLPFDMYNVGTLKQIPESDLELTGLTIDKDCKFIKEVDGVKYYVFMDNTYYEKNHYRRLKRAYKQGGVKQVWEYVNKYHDRANKK